MKLASALIELKLYLEKTGADEQVMMAWDSLKEELAKIIGTIMEMEEKKSKKL